MPRDRRSTGRPVDLRDLVDRERLETALRPPVPLTIFASTQDRTQRFVAEYRFPKSTSGEHFAIEVTMAPAPLLLDPVSYQERRSRFAQAGNSSPHEFPNIGLRAQRALSVGPAGSSYGVTFTTGDGKWDVSVNVSSLLPDGVNAPDFDVESFARLIEGQYEKKR